MLSNLQAHANELKSQGAAEAARDPSSTVTAQDAERVMIEETKKTGRVALHFNPDASPEEKAAQARSVRFNLCMTITKYAHTNMLSTYLPISITSINQRASV